MHNPNGLIVYPGSNEVFPGTLLPNGIDFFNAPAPEGNRVAILFANNQLGNGEYGFTQTLVPVLTANTRYDLSVEVGNIASGTATNGEFFNLDGFPGYRIDLLAGGVVIASDNDSLGAIIPEGEFQTSTVSFRVGQIHAHLGQALGIRLVNLNQIPSGFDAQTAPDLEVDFDDVRLDAVAAAVPEPTTLTLVGLGLAGLLIARKRRA